MIREALVIIFKHPWSVNDIWNVRVLESVEAVGRWSNSKGNVRASETHTATSLPSIASVYCFGDPPLIFNILLFLWVETFSAMKQLSLIDSKAIFLGRIQESSGDTCGNLSEWYPPYKYRVRGLPAKHRSCPVYSNGRCYFHLCTCSTPIP